LFIPDPDADFLPIPDPGVKKAPDPGSGSVILAVPNAGQYGIPASGIYKICTKMEMVTSCTSIHGYCWCETGFVMLKNQE
jgi:hypothetical protein